MKWASLPAWIATAYSLLVIVAAVIWHRRRTFRNRELPAVSVLKPLCGDSSYIYRALRSHVLQDYPDFEILFGASSARDPVLAEVERLQREFPSHKLRIVLSHSDALNPKVGLLEALAAAATHDLLVIQDDDVVASPGLLRSIVAPFRDPRTGLVTCLYRSHGRSFASRLEALGIVTEFIPRVVVARVLGVREFALGATIAIRKSVLAEIGGFQAVAPYLADDYTWGAWSRSGDIGWNLPLALSRRREVRQRGSMSGRTRFDGHAPFGSRGRPATMLRSSRTPHSGDAWRSAPVLSRSG